MVKKTDSIRSQQEYEKTESHVLCVTIFWKIVLQDLLKLGIYIPEMYAYEHQKLMYIHMYKKAYIRIFIAVLFIIAKTWKQLRSSSIVGYVNKFLYVCTMEYSLNFRKDERIQTQRRMYSIIQNM